VYAFFFAKSLQQRGNYRSSLVVYDRALEAINTSPPPTELICRIHFSRGQIYENNLRQFEDAIGQYERALMLADPREQSIRTFIAYANLHIGRCYIQLGRPEEAAGYVKKVDRDDDIDAYRSAREIMKHLQQ
jgi:tetratricopeptide (TPR) repeat protein